MKILIGYWQSKDGINAKCHNCNCKSDKHKDLKPAIQWARAHIKVCGSPNAWVLGNGRTEELLSIEMVNL